MTPKKLSPRQALNKAFLKVKPIRENIETFKTNLVKLIDQINETESEEFHKNLVADFLKNTYYSPSHFINTKGRNDLVIHNGKDYKSSVGVIVEAKKQTNKAEMLEVDNLNTKAFQELVLYFLRERITGNNLEIRYIVATNIYEWFVFDATVFEQLFVQDKALVNQFIDFEAKRLSGKTTDYFYKEIAKRAIALIENEIEFTHFDIRDYNGFLRNSDEEGDRELIALFKVFSPEHLLKLPFANDSNRLDKAFYNELLYIIGLTETKEGSKKLIGRRKESDRVAGSLLENVINQPDILNKFPQLEKLEQFGDTEGERLFNIGLELALTWINRVLFLKLLEAQLIKYHKGDKSFSFLSLAKVKNYNDLNRLFFNVLACKQSDRHASIKAIFANVPYLNSSLFEKTDVEKEIIDINNLSAESLPIFSSSVLKDINGKRQLGNLNALEYLFEFLNAYDFSSEGSEEIQEENKTLINASVLGLIFEKINGYKDGSFFTPGFITMYMCRETIRRAVVQKFNEVNGWNCQDVTQLHNKIVDNEQEANKIINGLKICDPAVGSGHFLVSALNEIIALKSELKILIDRTGKTLKSYHVEVVNDELIIIDDDGKLFEYNPKNKESQRIQETFFHEKQIIIETCLFGVDINPNSVKICRLRLWIELLKNAYYRVESNCTELETLPNIDINIKCGNSLISRFALNANLEQALNKNKHSIDSYRDAVQTYRNAESKEQKREMERLIEEIKGSFKTTLQGIDPNKTKLRVLEVDLYNLEQPLLFEETKAAKKAREQKISKLSNEIDKLRVEIEDIESGRLYENALEWRFEFPEVLNNEGDFVGFDVVIGNPPYFSLSKIKEKYQSVYFENNYQTYTKDSDIYCLFYEKGSCVLRNSGFLIYITSNSWLKTIYGDSLKKYLVVNMQPKNLLNIEDVQIFEEATVESNIITLKKDKANESFAVASLTNNYTVGSSLDEYFNKNCFEFKIPSISEWIIGNEKAGELKQKIELISKPLKDFKITINFGIKTGYNEAFIINEQTKEQLIKADSKYFEIIKPILRGRDLKKYSYEFSGVYLINTHNGIIKKNIEEIKVKENYPFIYDYLLSFRPRVEQRQDKGKYWTNLRNCTYLEDFEKPKIVWGEISDKPKFAFDDSNYYAEATTFLMTGEKLKYLLAILNSSLSEWYFNQISTTTGMGTNRWKKYKIEIFPIKEPTEVEELSLEKLVDQIISAKKSDSSADTTVLETEINQLVYQLYELTEAEIKIVEGETN